MQRREGTSTAARRGRSAPSRRARSATTGRTRATTSRHCSSTRRGQAPGTRAMYQMTVPEESRVMPNQAGTGGTWNFQLHPAFWFGMALCDNQSAPEYTHAPCVAGQRHEHRRRERPERRRLHRQAHRDGVPRAPVLSTGLGAMASGRQLRRAQVVRRDGDLQPEQRLQPQRPEQRRLPEHGRDRAGELRVHHALGDATRAAEPARGNRRHVHATLVVRSVHERGRQAGDRHPRLAPPASSRSSATARPARWDR